MTANREAVALGRDVSTSEEVLLKDRDRVLGTAIIGKTGTGKSSILEHLILADLSSATPGMVIDPHGRLADRIISAATPEQASRIILLEATHHAPFGLNLLALRKPVDDKDDVVTWAVDTVVETVKKLYDEQDSFAPRLERYLRLAARTLIAARRTLVDVPSLFEDDGFRAWCLSKVSNPLDAPALRNRWAAYERLRPSDQIQQTEALMNRLDAILDSPLLTAMVGSKATTVPFDRILAGGSMFLVSLPSETIGRARCDFIGAMLLCELANRVFSRSVATTSPPRLHLYLDEYQRFATSTTAEFLEEGRKYNIGVVLAHQTLYQIEDERIRNAARHAGTLVALGLTRPDADKLAGEFPVEPREERVEELIEADGTQPAMLPSPTPAEDIYLYGHTDPRIDMIARSFFSFTPRWTKELVMSELQIERRNADIVELLGDPRKSAGVEPRPGGTRIDPRVQVSAYDVNDLLIDAMAGKLVEPRALCLKLLMCQTWTPQVRLKLPEDPHSEPVTLPLRTAGVSTVYYYLTNASRSMIADPKCHCPPIDQYERREEERHRGQRPRRPVSANDPLGIHLPGCPAKVKRSLTPAEEKHNATVKQVYFNEATEFVKQCLLPWLWAHLQDLEALRADKLTDAMKEEDEKLAVMAWYNCWAGDWKWYGKIRITETGSAEAVTDDGDRETELYGKRRMEYAWMIENLRRRVWLLELLCDGLYRSPVLVSSGEQQPRMRTRHVVHPGQTQQDALNEFAASLVNPPDQYLAHVRLPREYHRTKLNPPVQAADNSEQLGAVRERSRRLYRIDDDGPEDGRTAPPPGPPLTGPPLLPPRRISRRPQRPDPAQQAQPDPSNDEE